MNTGDSDIDIYLFNLLVQSTNVTVLFSRSLVQLHGLDTRVIPDHTHTRERGREVTTEYC